MRISNRAPKEQRSGGINSPLRILFFDNPVLFLYCAFNGIGKEIAHSRPGDAFISDKRTSLLRFESVTA